MLSVSYANAPCHVLATLIRNQKYAHARLPNHKNSGTGMVPRGASPDNVRLSTIAM